MKPKELFLSCDWGTSSFRLRLIAVPESGVLAEVSDSRGIAAAYALWNEKGGNADDRFLFYQGIIRENIDKLQQQTQVSLSGMPLVISGMASANIGMMDLPYKRLPFSLDGSDLITHALPATNSFLYDTYIISGARSDNDVMRGEEVQLIGSVVDGHKEHVYVFPGTHSKHVYTQDNQAIAVNTYMTGEMFHLLSTKSILASSISGGVSFQDKNMQQAFAKGVKESVALNPLHAFFLVRTNDLFRTMSKEENYYYLSGLLIGLELAALNDRMDITLVSDDKIKDLYLSAFKIAGINNCQHMGVNEALIRGHYRILSRY
jgi:2-dehydro-3-deoxygalactonokinase